MRCFLLIVLAFSFTLQAYDGETRLYQMKNGLNVVLSENHAIPMTAMQAWVHAGSITEGARLGSGLSHYFEHMLFKGTPRRKPGEIASTIHACGGADMNAYTAMERTVYHFTILSKYNDTGLDILSDMLMNSVFDPLEAKKEQQVIVKEINMVEDNPQRKLNQTMLESAYKVFPYHCPIAGYEELFKKLTRDDILNYYHTMYSPSNVVVGLVGDFEMEKMLEKVDQYFGRWERTVVPPISLPVEPKQVNHRFLEVEGDIPYPSFCLAYHAASMYEPDHYALDVLAEIMGGGESSRLYKRLVDKEKIAHSVSAESMSWQYPGLFSIQADCDSKNYSQVKNEILDEVNRLVYEDVTAEELGRVKNQAAAREIYAKESLMGQGMRLSNSFFYTGTLDFEKRKLEGIKTVTAADIRQVAGKYLRFDNLSIVLMNPKKEKKELPETIEVSAAKTLEVKKTILDNGMILLLLEDKKLPIISASAAFFGGSRLEDEKNNGIGGICSQLLTRSTGKYSKEQIQNLVEVTGASLSASSGSQSLTVNLKTLSENFDRIWPVFVSVIRDSKINGVEFEKTRDLAVAQLRISEKDINDCCDNLFRKLVFKGSPYRLPSGGTAAGVEKLLPESAETYCRKILTPSNMVLCLVGDFKADEMELKIRNDFSGFSGEKFVRPSEIAAEALNGKMEETQHLPDKRQCIIRMGFNTGVKITDSDKYVLEVISNVLSGLGSRLFENLRSKLSLAYHVSAFEFSGYDAGSYTFYIATVPEKKDLALQKMKEEIERLKKEPVPAAELEKVKNKLLGSYSKRKNGTQYLAMDMSGNELLGLGYREILAAPEKIMAVTDRDIIRVVNKYFDMGHYAIAIAEP
ncbi:MAG: pitrilysin family protein [Candidatus Wallbacteria bacterium]|nr:pitrilysin family protein [Candidatus Wallbacteria bacterium]